MNEGPLLLSPTFPPPVPMGGGFGGFDNRVRKNLLRKTVDYQASTLRYLESRIWQRDKRDTPVLQPDSAYFNDLVLPVGMKNQPVNAVTTKFVRASTNKQRSPIFCTSWLPDGRRLATGAASGEFTLWNGVNFNYESILQAHDGPIRSMKWSHNGEWMVTTDDRGFVKYWQSNFNNVHTFQAHNEPIRCSSFSPNDSKLATCSDDGTVRIFDFMSCSVEWLLRGHGADVKCCDWHPRKSLLVSGSKDNQQPVKVWDCRSGQSVTTIHAHKATVQSVSWNKNGNWLLTASRDSLIKIYDIRAMKELCVLKGHKKEVNTVAWHPIHESLFASGGSDGAILFWLVGNDREVGGMESAHEGFIWSLSWHPLGHILCSGSNDHTSKFWCRNRPGEELKDKYNTFNNPFGVEEMESSSYQFPGMGTGMRGNSTAITLPPPSSRLANHAVTLPPPNWQRDPLFPKKNSFDGQTNPGAPPRVDVPVLGADIIKETFSDTVKHPESPQVGVENENKPKLFGGEDQFNPPAPRPPPHFPHQHNGPLPPHMNEFDYPRGPHPRPPGRPPMPPDFVGDRTVRHSDHLPPPPGFHPEMRDPRMRDWRPPGPFGPRGPPRGNFRYPPDDFEERGRPFGNRFSWHRHDYPGRRPSFDEEDWGGPYEMGGNPYSYRRPPPPHEGFRERQDPRMMGEHPGPMERDEHQIHGPPHPVPPHSQKGPPPPQPVPPSDDSRIEAPGRPHERFDNHPDHYSQPPSHAQEGRAPHPPPPPASSSTLQMPEQNQQGPPQHPRDPRDPRRSRTLPEIPPSQATQGHPPQGMPPQALIPPSHPPQAHHHSSAQDNVPPQNVNEKQLQNNFPSPVGPPPSQPLFPPHSQHQFHHPSHQGPPVMSGPPPNRPQFPGQDQQGKEQQGPPPLFQGQDQRRNFPPDQQGPPRRDFPPDQQGLPRRDFPPDQQGPPRRDFPPDQQGPPRRDFPPDQQGPPRRDFPPDQQGPPRRDFPPDQQGPPRRDFPPDQGPPRRDFPPDQQGPPRRDFPPDQQGPPRRDFPPDQGPPRRDFPPDQQGPPRRDFPPDQQGPPRRDFPPDPLPPENRYSSDPRGPPDQQRHGDPRIYRGPPPIEQRPYPPNEQGYAFSRGPPPTSEQRYPPNQQGYRGPLPPGNDQRYPPDPMQERQQQPPAHLPPGHRDQFGRFDGAQGPQQQQVHGPGSHYERHFPEQQHGTYSSNEPPQPPGPGYPGGDPRYEHWTASGGPPSRPGRPYPEQRWGGRRDSPQWNQREQHQDGDPRERRGENNWDRSEGDKRDREERERRKPRDKDVSRRAPSGTEHRNTSSSRRKSDSDNKDNPPPKRNRKDSGERDKDKGKETKEKDKGKARSKSKK